MFLDPEESDSQWKGWITGGDHSNLPRRSSHCWAVSLLKPCPLSTCFAFTLLVKELGIFCLFSGSSCWKYWALAPCLHFFSSPSLQELLELMKQVCGSLVVRERNGWAERGGVACRKRRSGHGERGERSACWGYFSCLSMAWCWFCYQKKVISSHQLSLFGRDLCRDRQGGINNRRDGGICVGGGGTRVAVKPTQLTWLIY